MHPFFTEMKPRASALASPSHNTSSYLSFLSFSQPCERPGDASASSNKTYSEMRNTTPKRSISRTISTPTRGRELCADRFIPVRNDMVTRKLIYDTPEDSATNSCTKFLSEEEQSQLRYQLLLEGQVLRTQRQNSSNNSNSLFDENACSSLSSSIKESSNKLLQFKTPTKDDNLPHTTAGTIASFPFSWDLFEEEKVGSLRKITTKPHRVLDAPQLEDDYYLNLIDWSKSNILAVALKNAIHLWSGTTGNVKQLCQLPNEQEIYTSVSWSARAERLATGISSGKIEIWDFEKMKVIRDDLEAHSERVGCLAWNGNDLLASGSKDQTIIIRDTRIKGKGSSIMRFKGHKQEICGLKWSPNDFQLASGGNDNKLFIWNARKQEREACFSDHKAAIKALAWSPHQSGLLLSGGGNNDKTIKVWNTHTMKNIRSVNTGSQVCNMLFSRNSNELITTHGFSNNEIVVWNYSDFTRLGVMEGHASRVLYMALSPDGETVVTGAGGNDETLRFWHVFPPAEEASQSALIPSSINLR